MKRASTARVVSRLLIDFTLLGANFPGYPANPYSLVLRHCSADPALR